MSDYDGELELHWKYNGLCELTSELAQYVQTQECHARDFNGGKHCRVVRVNSNRANAIIPKYPSSSLAHEYIFSQLVQKWS